MRVLITEDDRFITEGGDPPVVGRSYFLEDATTGTGPQNRYFHKLCQLYYGSGLYSYPAKTWLDLREQIKLKLGEGFEKVIYADISPDTGIMIHEVDRWEDVPARIRNHPDFRQCCRGKLKSWADYTKKQRRNCIENLKMEMITNGVDGVGFYDLVSEYEGIK